MSVFQALVPILLTLGGALAALLLEILPEKRGRRALAVVVSTALIAALAVEVGRWGAPASSYFSGAFRVDGLSVVLGAVILLAALVAVFFGAPYLRRERAVTGEFYVLLLLSASGGQVLVSAGDLLGVLVGLELMSLPAYALAAFLRRDGRGIEAGLKYFLPGAAASAFLAYGAALVYGATGTLSFQGVGASVARGGGSTLLAAGAALVLSAFAFKVAVVPFHAWSLDTYDGAPAPVSAFLSGVIKAGAFGVWLRAFHEAFPTGGDWATLLGLLALATLTIGNFGAFAQGSVKRMMAYSSLAQVGYVLVGLCTLGAAPFNEVARAVTFYVAAYALMAMGAFGWLAWAGGVGESARSFEAFRGYGRRHPIESGCMTLFLLSLAGVPPTAGFFGKVLLFQLAVAQGHLALVLVALLFSLLAFAYYLRLVVLLYAEAPEGEPSTAEPEADAAGSWQRLGLGLCALGTLALGFLKFPF